jgi:lipopolysaccharide/colanic/teichoic acid biosynthesis glycosyltransferase
MIQQNVKRLTDICVSTLCIIIFFPFMAAIAFFIRLQDGGPVLFKQERAGKDETPFTLLKFRTMKVTADPFGQSPSAGDDPRLIKGGQFLREYSLDELPQFFNVLMGHMSIIGPRPLYVSQINSFSEKHKIRLRVRPGITGLSQIYLRSELTSPESLDMEVAYVQNQSLWNDIKIFFLTIGVVLTKKGIYEKDDKEPRR